MFSLTTKSIHSITSDCGVIIYSKIASLTAYTELMPFIKQLKASDEISEKKSRLTLIHLFDKSGPKRILLAGTGPDVNTVDTYRHLAGTISRRLHPLGLKKIVVTFSDHHSFDIQECVKASVEGYVLGNYDYKKFDSSSTKKNIQTVLFSDSSFKNVSSGICDSAHSKAHAQNIARQLATSPANELTPKDVVDYAKKLFKSTKVSVTSKSMAQIQKLGMGGLYSVGKGSDNPPYLLELTYKGSAAKKPIVLVGKGVTFDTGGISIKPSRSMSAMKADMSGAAAVIGAMHAIAAMGLKRHVVALVPLAENMPSARAYKPGDVLTAMNGKTVEVLNTDAEGRLILADALCYGAEKKPALMIDIATLTGACSVALGEMAAAVLGNNQAAIDQCTNLHLRTGERTWQLPLYDEYKDYLKSDVADMANCAENRQAGTCTAAKFLEAFVDDQPWIHVDIASVMSHSSSKGYHVKGMAGFGTRTLIGMVEDGVN